MICNVLCNLHTISNNCAKYEHHWSKNEGGVRITSHKLIVSIFDLVFWHQCQSGDKKPTLLSTPHRQSLCHIWTLWVVEMKEELSLSLSHWYPGSGVVLDCIDSWSLHPYLLSCYESYYSLCLNLTLTFDSQIILISWKTYHWQIWTSSHKVKWQVLVLALT